MLHIRPWTAAALLLTLILVAVPALADEPTAEAQPSPEAVAPLADVTPAPRSPLAQGIEQILAREKEQVAALSERLQANPDTETALTLQRRIQVIKLRAERDVLQLQLDLTRAAAAPEQVERLENAIAALEKLTLRAEARLATVPTADTGSQP